MHGETVNLDTILFNCRIFQSAKRLRYRLDNQRFGIFSRRGTILFSLKPHLDRPYGPSGLVCNAYRGKIPRFKETEARQLTFTELQLVCISTRRPRLTVNCPANILLYIYIYISCVNRSCV
jgi:hypothetical protein